MQFLGAIFWSIFGFFRWKKTSFQMKKKFLATIFLKFIYAIERFLRLSDHWLADKIWDRKIPEMYAACRHA